MANTYKPMASQMQSKVQVSELPSSEPELTCPTCDERPVVTRGECQRCYDYRRSTGTTRPRTFAIRAHEIRIGFDGATWARVVAEKVKSGMTYADIVRAAVKRYLGMEE